MQSNTVYALQADMPVKCNASLRYLTLRYLTHVSVGCMYGRPSVMECDMHYARACVMECDYDAYVCK